MEPGGRCYYTQCNPYRPHPLHNAGCVFDCLACETLLHLRALGFSFILNFIQGSYKPMLFTPQHFVKKWKRLTAREKQTHQEHFIDLYHLVGHQMPNDYNPTRTRFGWKYND